MYDVHEICLLATLGSFWLTLLPVLNMRRRHMANASFIQSQVVPVVLRPERSSKCYFFIGTIDAPMQSCRPLLNLEVEVGNSRVIVWRIQLLP